MEVYLTVDQMNTELFACEVHIQPGLTKGCNSNNVTYTVYSLHSDNQYLDL